MKDSKNDYKGFAALNPQSISSNTTTAGTEIDLANGNIYNSCTFYLQSGTITDGSYVPALFHGDVSGALSAVDTTNDLVGTYADATFVAADDNAVKSIGYVGGKRYVELRVVSTGVTTGGALGAIAMLGHPEDLPVA